MIVISIDACRIYTSCATWLLALAFLMGCGQRLPVSDAELWPLMQEDARTGLVSWGYVRLEYDANGREMPPGRYIIKPRFAAAAPFSEGLAVVNIGGMGIDGSYVKGGEWAFINPMGNVVIRGFKGYAGSFREGLAAVQPAEDGLRGYIDTNGVMVIRPQFIIAREFSEGLAAVRTPTNQYGYINKQGEMVISPIYHLAEAFTSDVARVNLGAAGGYAETFIDRNGNVLNTK
jgi:hypothetical protein